MTTEEAPPPLSETREAGEIVGACDETIIPIFPARHALTDTALFSVTSSGRAVGNPTAIGASSDHELRRIRQGYIYIYARNGHPDDQSSDDSGTWLVFRYVSQTGHDDSSGHVRDDVSAPTGRYQFYKLEWTGSGADGKWEVLDNRRYPYAFVNRQVSEIEIAYSEERWPGYLFLMAELDSGVRRKLMTRVNLIAESTPHSVPMARIAEHVAEFTPNAQPNPSANALRYTAFQPETTGQVVVCQQSRERGRVVAVQDHLGELLDLQAAHLAKSHSLKTFSAEYQYPLMIGKGVKNLWEHIDHDSGTLRDYFDWNGTPVHEDYLGTYDALEVRQNVLNDEIRALVRAYWTVSTRTGTGTVLTELEVVLGGLDSIGDEASVRRMDYAFFLLSKAFQTLGTSAYGSASMAAMLGDAATDNSRQWFIIFKELFTVAATASQEYLTRYRTHMNITFAVTAKELALAWTQSPGGIIHKAPIERILGVTEIAVPVSPNNIDDTLRRTFARVGLTGQRPSRVNVDGNALTAAMDGGTPVPTRLVNVPYYEITGTGTITAQGQALSEAYRAADLGTKGGAMLLSFYAAFQTLNNWNNVRRSFTAVGAIARDPRVQVASVLLEAASGIRALQTVPGSVQFTNGVSTSIFNRMFASGGDRFFNAGTVTAQATNGAGSVSGSMLRFVTLGNIAGAVGVVLASFNAREGFRADDMAAGFGNSLIAAGGLVVLATGATGFALVPGAIVGGLMIVAGTVATFFTDSDVDYWVRHGFWGRSQRYWEGEDRLEVGRRIDLAKSLMNGSEPYRSAFEQELNDYRDLTGSLQIENAAEGDMRIEIACSALESVADLGRLEATVRVVTASIGMMGMGGAPMAGRPLDVQKHYVAPGMVHLILSERPVPDHDRISDLRIDASYPKLNGAAYEDRLTIKAWQL